MKRAAWYVVAGTVAGFAGVLGLHGRAAPPSIVAQPTGGGPSPAAGKPGAARAAGPTPTAGPAQATGPTRRASGALIGYGYGELSVAITVRGTQITDVSVPVLRTAEPYSQQLAAQVLPMLKHEVLAVHSDRISAVSGATYTSQAYADSIQSALDKLHLK
jgi:uncharacterized protein with FMN-binding domain